MRTTTQLIDEFLRHREGTVTPAVVDRDRSVLDRLHAYLDANGPVMLDETTGDPVPRIGGGIGLSDLVDVELVVMNVAAFSHFDLDQGERGCLGTLRQFTLWLHRIGELDPCSYLEMKFSLRPANTPTERIRWGDRR